MPDRRGSVAGTLAFLVVAMMLACGGGPTLATHGGVQLVFETDGFRPELAVPVVQARLEAMGQPGEVSADGDTFVVGLVGKIPLDLPRDLSRRGYLMMRSWTTRLRRSRHGRMARRPSFVPVRPL